MKGEEESNRQDFKLDVMYNCDANSKVWNR